MKFFAVCTIATLLFGVATAEICKSTNPSGTACIAYADLPGWMQGYANGETCFGGWCFINTDGGMEPCECFDDSVTYDNPACNPATYGQGNTMCIYDEGVFGAKCGSSGPLGREITAQADKDAIVEAHNKLRANVANGLETQGVGGGQPAAANMRQMVWSDELAIVAQRWADQCVPGHDSNRNTASFPYVGQNYASMSSSQEGGSPDWAAMVQMWYDEVADMPATCVNPYSQNGATGVIGHYTQVVWAESYAVGCGYVYFNNGPWYTKVLMCNYGPGGNMMGGSMYEEGAAGSNCPSGTSATADGLCG